MNPRYKVIDSRNNGILFEDEIKQKCINFMDEMWEEDSTDYIYAYLVEPKGGE